MRQGAEEPIGLSTLLEPPPIERRGVILLLRSITGSFGISNSPCVCCLRELKPTQSSFDNFVLEVPVSRKRHLGINSLAKAVLILWEDKTADNR
jgi:hypothetical protein